MRLRAAAAAILVVATIALPGVGHAVAAPEPTCDPVKPGGPLTDTPWAQTRLNFQRAWRVTKGQGVRVAVIDTGLDRRHPQLKGVHVGQGHNVIPFPGFSKTDVTDCSGIGHGTSVTAIIAAQQIEGGHFLGVAPDVTIIPIKQTNTTNDKTSNADGLADGIDAAIRAGAQVVNISITLTNPGSRLRAAVARAARANLVIVAAGGNDAEGQNFPAYPAAYSTEFPNVIAVSASDAKDGIGPFSETGSYIDVAAPGVGVVIPAPARGYIKADGTSFAAPYVTGTVALVLAAHPQMTAAQVRSRIEATADRPPASVPDSKYGWGIINPYLAVTSVRDDALAAPAPRPGPALRNQAAAPQADRHLAHVALATAVALLGLAALAIASAAVLRGRRPSQQRTA